MPRALFVLAILLLPVLAAAQSVLTALHPQPRAAYARAAAEPFALASARSILLDPAGPDWSAALQLNAGLRARGRDTLAIGTWSPGDTSRGVVLLGICAAFINARLAQLPDQRVQVTALYPGPEGYVLDVGPACMLLSGSDTRGLRYGVETLLQLLDLRGTRNDVEACRIVDAPEFPVRWFYFNSYFDAADDFRNARGVWDRALRSRLNGVAFSDGLHFSHLSLMPRSYLDSIAGMGAFAAARDLEIIPCVFPFGWSNYFLALDPDLASGLPVKEQRFVVDGDTARLLPRIPVSFPNGGFEARNGDVFPGFDWIDQPGKVSFADTLIRHSGATSIRFENIGVYSPEWGHGRMLRVLAVTPFTLFHVRAWVKTDAFVSSDLLRIVILDMKSKDLIHNEFRIPPTTEWRQLDFTFNSLAADSIMIWSGSWQGKTGRVWWDDFSIEEVPFVNILRRPGAPVTITFPTGTRVCREGIDVDSLFDPLRDSMYGPGVYSSWHTPPTMRIRPGGSVRNGDTLLVSYCHALNTYGDYGQVTATMSEERTLALMARQAALLDSVLHPKTFFMQHDEIRMMNWDDGDRTRGLAPSAILADNVRRCMDSIRRLNPGADIWDWSDMFDDYHNAVDGYYLVNGSMAGVADLLPRDLGIVNWNSQPHAVRNSLAFFASRGFRQISAPYYDQDQNAIREWKEWTRGVPNFRGMMYTTWKSQYTHLEPFGEYAWNHAPYILHEPPAAIGNDGSIRFRVRSDGDRYDSAWQLVATTLCYRTSPDAPFTAVALPAVPGRMDSTDLQLPQGDTWLQWFLLAYDNRGWMTKVPFGDSVYYELGSIPTEFAVHPSPARLTLHGLYPDPVGGGGLATLDWTAAPGADTEIAVTDVLGRTQLRLSHVASPSEVQCVRLDLSRLSPGVYVLTISARGVSVSKTFVKR